MSQMQVLKIGINLIILFMIIPIHEFAHAWAADKMGDDTPRYQGRLTLNPIKHIDPIGAVCMLISGFGWGRPVQVNPLNFKHYRKGMALCAAAGPISNIIVGFLGMIIYKIVAGIYMVNPIESIGWLMVIFNYFTAVNLSLALFNLIPIPPLDGSKILGYFTSAKFDAFIARYQTYISIGFLALIFTGLLSTPLGALQQVMFWIMDKLTFWVDIIVNLVVNAIVR